MTFLFRLMANRSAQAVAGTPFAPRALVPVSDGRTTVNLYPVIDYTMMVQERARAFQINKTALLSQALDLCVMLNALGQKLNISASVKGMIKEWLRYFQDSPSDFQRFQLLSFHNDAGDQINNTSMPDYPAILWPAINGTYNRRHKAIKFVPVQLTLDFISLFNVVPPGHTVLHSTFYIELPQTSIALVNGRGNKYTL